MPFVFPNPPAVSGPTDSLFLNGTQSYLYMTTGAYSSLIQSGPGCPSMSTAPGSIASPTMGTANAVEAIGRVLRTAPVGSSGTAGFTTGTSTLNPFSVRSPGVTNGGGFRCTLIGGLESFVPAVGETTFFQGVSHNSGVFPSPPGIPLTDTNVAWFGIYKEQASSSFRVGFKGLGTTAITDLGALSVPFAANTGFVITVDMKPDLTTDCVVQHMAALGVLNTVFTASTSGFNPGRLPFSPTVMGHKHSIANELRVFINGFVINNYTFGAASL